MLRFHVRPPRGAVPELPVGADGDRHRDDDADGDVVPVGGEVQERQAVVEDGEEQHPEERAGEGALAAEHAGAADDHRGDDLQLLADDDVRDHRLDDGEVDDRRDAREQARQSRTRTPASERADAQRARPPPRCRPWRRCCGRGRSGAG